jgi:hypothetical protein
MNSKLLGTIPQLLASLAEGQRQLDSAQAKVDGIKYFIKSTELEIEMQNALQALTLAEAGVNSANHWHWKAKVDTETLAYEEECLQKFYIAVTKATEARNLVNEIESKIISLDSDTFDTNL